MRPRRLDERTVHAKLHLMDTLLRRLTRSGEIDRAAVENDMDLRLILERIITQVVDLAVAVNSQIATAELGTAPEDYSASFTALAEVGAIERDLARALAPSTGLRNILIHAYLDLDVDRFVSSIPLAREGFTEYVRQVAGWLLEREQHD